MLQLALKLIQVHVETTAQIIADMTHLCVFQNTGIGHLDMRGAQISVIRHPSI